MQFLSRTVGRVPLLNKLAAWLYPKLPKRRFPGSESYWLARYAGRGDAGPGSFGELAQFKAGFLNAFVAEHGISFVIEHGCGDGHQLDLAEYPQYLGFDISPDALARCRERFRTDASKRFALTEAARGEVGDLALSLDVIYHLVEGETFEAYMRRLFASSSRYVIIYSSNRDEQDALQPAHVLHRRFSGWIERQAPQWRLVQRVPNRHPFRGDVTRGSFADFYVYEKGG